MLAGAGGWESGGSAHPGNQLCEGNRSRLWEPTQGSSSHPSRVDRGPGTGSSGGDRGFPICPSAPPPCSWELLPAPEVRGDKCPPRLLALDQYRNLRRANRASGGSYRAAAAVAAAAGPPAGSQRSLSGPLHSRFPVSARSCPGSDDAIPAPGV